MKHKLSIVAVILFVSLFFGERAMFLIGQEPDQTTAPPQPAEPVQTETAPLKAQETKVQIDGEPIKTAPEAQDSQPAVETATPAAETPPEQGQEPPPEGETTEGQTHSGRENAVLSGLPPVVDYEIHARIDAETMMIYGTQLLTYTNHSPDIIADLRFHLYMNAFKNNRSTYAVEKGGLGFESIEEFGFIHIEEMLIGGVERSDDLAFYRDEDSAPQDQTVARVGLRQPLFPGETISVAFKFRTKLPKASDRTGYAGSYVLAAQWFPKIGVWETLGFRGVKKAGWNCRPFHAHTEFYANFGRYSVTLEVPSGFQVGATGKLVETKLGQDTSLHSFEQDRIHDFAFTVSPEFIRLEQRFQPEEWISEQEYQKVMSLFGISREEASLDPIDLILLIQPEHKHQADRHFNIACTAIKQYGLRLGRYPYETLTMVDPPKQGRLTGGMEYPTFITLGTRPINPPAYLDLEDLIIHEFGHQYWYGLVASNEFEEAWLDEGLTTYSSHRIIDEVYGGRPMFADLFHLLVPYSFVLGFENLTLTEKNRLNSLRDHDREPIMRPSWDQPTAGTYTDNAYTDPSNALYQLERELGSDLMARVMRTYFQTWSFRHPSGQDFFHTAETVSGRQLDWFFSELFGKAGSLDYRVARVETLAPDLESGYKEGPEGPFTGASNPEKGLDPNPPFTHMIELRKEGNLSYPVAVEVTFADGRIRRLPWDGQYHRKRFYLQDAEPVQKVVIDPEGKLFIDSHRANNSYFASADSRASKRWSLRFGLFAQHLLQTLAGGL